MKLNWHRFLDTVYSWTVCSDWSYTDAPRVRITRYEKNGTNVRYSQLLERIWNMSFYDFRSAKSLVRKYNKTHDEKYIIYWEKKI